MSYVQEGSAERGHCSKCRSGHGPGGMGKEVEEVHSSACGEVNLGEHSFNPETTLVERQAMFHLEREMDATLMFKHGGG